MRLAQVLGQNMLIYVDYGGYIPVPTRIELFFYHFYEKLKMTFPESVPQILLQYVGLSMCDGMSWTGTEN